MKSKSIQKSTLLVMIQRIIAISILVGFIIYPTISRIYNLENYISDTHKQIDSQHTRVNLLKKSLQQLPEIQKNLETYTQMTINKGDELYIIELFEQMGEKHNLEQNLSISSSETQKNSKAKTSISSNYYTLKFNHTGTYENQMKFLSELEHLPFYTIIDTINMSKKSIKNSTSTLSNFQFEGIIYAS